MATTPASTTPVPSALSIPECPSLPVDGPHLVSLTTAAKITGVNYHTFIEAHRHGRLALIRLVKVHNESLHIALGELVDYMTHRAPVGQRWLTELIPVGQVMVVPGRQPRLSNSANMVGELILQLRSGGPVPAVYVSLHAASGKYLLIDGHRRFEAHQQACLPMIAAVLIPLADTYHPLLAMALNLRHGENLSPTEKVAQVRAYLAAHPGVLAQIQAGQIAHHELARHLAVSPATISRALVSPDKPKAPTHHARKLLADLDAPLEHCRRTQQVDHTLDTALVLYRVSAYILGSYPPAVRKDALARLKLNTTAMGGTLSPALRSLIDRRGGDRVRPAPEDTGDSVADSADGDAEPREV